MRAIDMSTPLLVTASESLGLADAARLMRDHCVGDVVITRDGSTETQPMGIVTDRDIVVHAIACDLKPDDITVADMRMREPVCIQSDADLMEITATMHDQGVRRLIVLRDNTLVGVISLDNIIEALAELTRNLSNMLARQFDYEQQHLVTIDAERENVA